MAIRYPPALKPGGRIGVTSPSSGVAAHHRPRLDFCLEHLRAGGYEVAVGRCMDGDHGVVSAPAPQRAAELTELLTSDDISVVIPPWGGELAVELLPHLDFDRLSRSPGWLVGFSDISTLLLAITTMTGVATLHGQNLMDTPYRVPKPLLPWTHVVSQPAGASFTQGASARHTEGYDRWEDDPTFTEYTLSAPGEWSLLRPVEDELRVSGRLIGGCIETVSVLAGTPYGDVPSFAEAHAPEGLIVYLEASEDAALTIARSLWGVRLAGWFDHANAILIGRTRAPGSGDFSQRDAVMSALGDLEIPIVLDVNCGHVAPHLALVNGALAEVTLGTIVQRLC